MTKRKNFGRTWNTGIWFRSIDYCQLQHPWLNQFPHGRAKRSPRLADSQRHESAWVRQEKSILILERGFIRAEIVSFADLMECGSYTAAKEKGLVRSEGKEYIMKDGDVTLFRFNV